MEDVGEAILKCEGFEWDEGNSLKSWLKHQVSSLEAEQIFLNQPLIVGEDEWHSQDEERFFTLGKTEKKRLLFVCFTLRGKLIRVISARDMNRKESEVYRKHEKTT